MGVLEERSCKEEIKNIRNNGIIEVPFFSSIPN